MERKMGVIFQVLWLPPMPLTSYISCVPPPPPPCESCLLLRHHIAFWQLSQQMFEKM